MNYLQSLHDATTRLIEIEKLYYSTFPDQPDLEPEHMDTYAMAIAKLYPILEQMWIESRGYSTAKECAVTNRLLKNKCGMSITTDSAWAHLLFKVARDHMACISTVENSVGLYDCFRHNDDLEPCLEHDPIYMGHLGKNWN